MTKPDANRRGAKGVVTSQFHRQSPEEGDGRQNDHAKSRIHGLTVKLLAGSPIQTVRPDKRHCLESSLRKHGAVIQRMSARVAILSPGLWRKRDYVGRLSGLKPCFAAPPVVPRNVSAVAGWGYKPTAIRARKFAEHRGLPYLAFEDGFIRSVQPGPVEVPQSIIMDDIGIYYDATRPSRLEQLLLDGTKLDHADTERAKRAIELLRKNRLSKYNDATPFPDKAPRFVSKDRSARVLLLDQTKGDASISGGLACSSTFEQMVACAVKENPRSEIIVKLHPEVVTGRKEGYLARLALQHDVTILSDPVNPWLLLEEVGKVFTVSSQLGFEALLAGCEVVCFGVPFYAGWGLTDDRQPIPRLRRQRSLLEIVDVVYFRYCQYFCAWTGRSIDFFTAAEQLMFRRDHYHKNSRPMIAHGITAWKRPLVRGMLSGAAGAPEFISGLDAALTQAKCRQAAIVAWGSKARSIRTRVTGAEVPLITVEDGFLRSVGLGANFVPALSLVFDNSGIYYDPANPSDLELILQETEFQPSDIDKAVRLRRRIVDAQLTKYNLASKTDLPDLPTDRPVILVPGQVADDESIRLGAANLFASEPLSVGGANLALLKAVRLRHPDAHLIYKPHPDVEAGLRAGKIDYSTAAGLADLVYSGGSLPSLFPVISQVETATSLAGFEALLRGISVVTHGQPFYAGWGLTEDLNPPARRARRLTIDQLVAGALLLYPHYLDPYTRTACPVEIVVNAIAAARSQKSTRSDRMMGFLRMLFAKGRYLSVKTFGRNG